MNRYYLNRIINYIIANQKEEIRRLELNLATVRSGGSIDNSSEIKRLTNEIQMLKRTHREELLAASTKPAETTVTTRVDTILKTIIVYKDKESNGEDLALLKKQQEELSLKLAKSEAARVAAEKQSRLDNERIAQENKRKQEVKDAERDVVIVDEAKIYETDPVDFIPREVDPNVPTNKNYYVITISSLSKATAESWLAKMLRDFPDARILPQPNGYYRVGVFAAKDRALAFRILEETKRLGHVPAWLSIE